MQQPSTASTFTRAVMQIDDSTSMQCGANSGTGVGEQEDLNGLVVRGRTGTTSKAYPVPEVLAGVEEPQHIVEAIAKEGMSACAEFHSSLDELRRVTNTNSAPLSDQVTSDDSSIRELLRHLDSIMLQITEEGETEEHENACHDASGSFGSLSGTATCCINSQVDEPSGPLTLEQSIFFEKKRFMDYTNCLTPEETEEMYDRGRMPELCPSSEEYCTHQIGFMRSIQSGVTLPVQDAGHGQLIGASEFVSRSAPALESVRAGQNSSVLETPRPSAEFEAIVAICTGAAFMDIDPAIGDNRLKAGGSPQGQPTETISRSFMLEEGQRGDSQCATKPASAQAPVNVNVSIPKGGGTPHGPVRKRTRGVPSQVAGERGAVLNTQKNSTHCEVKREVSLGCDDHNVKGLVRKQKRRSGVEGVAKDQKCKRLLLNTEKTGRTRKREPHLPKEKDADGHFRKRPQNKNGNSARRASSKGPKSSPAVSGSRLAPRCELNESRPESVMGPEEKKWSRSVKRRKTLQENSVDFEGEHNGPDSSDRAAVTVNQVTMSDAADIDSPSSTVPPALGAALETRIWRPKVWPPDHTTRRLCRHSGRIVTTEFEAGPAKGSRLPQPSSPRYEIRNMSSSNFEERPASHEPQDPIVSQSTHSVLSSPDELCVASDAKPGVGCTKYRELSSSGQVFVPACAMTTEDVTCHMHQSCGVADTIQAKFENGNRQKAGARKVASHSTLQRHKKITSCMEGVMNDVPTGPHKDIEQARQNLRGSHVQERSVNRRRKACSQHGYPGSSLASCLSLEQVPTKFSARDPASTVSQRLTPLPPASRVLPALRDPEAEPQRAIAAASSYPVVPEDKSGPDGDASLSRTTTNLDLRLENVVNETTPTRTASPLQVLECSNTSTDQQLRITENDPLRIFKEYPTELKESQIRQSHESSECANASEECGPGLGNLREVVSEGSFEGHVIQLTSNQPSFVEAQFAIFHGLQSEQELDGIRIIHLLMSCVEALCSEDENIALASIILKRLINMVDVRGYPLQRVVAHFATGLQLAFEIDKETASQASPGRTTKSRLCSTYQVLHEVLPYIKFAHFTANQALLEAFEGDKEMHIVDYDIMDGMQWPPLMHALATARNQHHEHGEHSGRDKNKEAIPVTPTKLKITAVCRGRLPENSIATNVSETGRRLQAFAKLLDLPFEFQVVQEPDVTTEEQLQRHVAQEGAWHKIFEDLIMHERKAPSTAVVENVQERGREEKIQGKSQSEADTGGTGRRLSCKSVSVNCVITNVGRSTGQPEIGIGAEAGSKLKHDSASESFQEMAPLQAGADSGSVNNPNPRPALTLQRHWSANADVQEGQVDLQRRPNLQQRMLTSGTGKSRDRERVCGDELARAKVSLHCTDQDEDTPCSGNRRARSKTLPLKLPAASTDHSSHAADVHEKSARRTEQNRADIASKASSKRNQRSRTQAIPPGLDARKRHHSGNNVCVYGQRALSRSLAKVQMLVDNEQYPEEGGCKRSGGIITSGEFRKGNAMMGGVEEQDLLTRYKDFNAEIKAKPSKDKLLNDVDQHEHTQCAKEQLHTKSPAVEESIQSPLDGRRTENDRKTAPESWVNSAAKGADGGSHDDLSCINRLKVRQYVRRKRPTDKTRTSSTPGDLDKMVKDYPNVTLAERTTATAKDDVLQVTGQESTSIKVRSRQNCRAQDQALVNGGSIQEQEMCEESVSAKSHLTSFTPEVSTGLAVNCMVHLPHMAHREAGSVYSFLAAAAKFSPRIVTVGEDGVNVPGTEDYLNYFCQGLYHFCAFSDSLEESLPGKHLASSAVEQAFCAPRILSMLRSGRAHMKQQRTDSNQSAAATRWGSIAPRVGFHSLPLSPVNKFQGKLLLELFPIGYDVLEENDAHTKLILAWKGRPMVAVSAWKT